MTKAKESTELHGFEGKDVLSTAVMVTKAGDGLSKALKVEPREMHVGDRGVMVLEYEVGKVRFDPVPDTDGLQRVHILVAGTATFVDEETVREALDSQQRKIDAFNGVFHLPFGDDGPVKPDDMSDEEWEESGRYDAELAAAVAAKAADDSAGG